MKGPRSLQRASVVLGKLCPLHWAVNPVRHGVRDLVDVLTTRRYNQPFRLKYQNGMTADISINSNARG